MGVDDFQKDRTSLRAWIGRLLGEGEGYKAYLRRRRLRRAGIAAAVLALFAAFAVGGYAIGSSKVGDADSYRQAGTAAGRDRGAAVDTSQAYDRAYEPARDSAFKAAYREAFVSSYRDAFEKADLALPSSSQVKVSGP
jgi:hypothetical protein